jgi:hypothetical protein
MAAGLGFKTFTTGEVLTAADTNGYLMQGILVFASAAARDSAITSPQEGQFAYLKDTNVTTYYTGSAWANVDTTGMTNPMTTTGDMIYSSSGSTPARLGIGSTGNVLTVAGGVPSWAAPAGGGSGLTFIAGATFTSSAAVNVNNCFSATYTNYLILGSITSNSTQVNVGIRMRASGTDNTTSDYDRSSISNFSANLTGGNSLNASSWTEVISTYASSTGNNFRIEMFNPFATENTTGFATSTSFNSSDNNQQLVGMGKPVTTSFDGFSLIANTGNITGFYKVYGLADA